MKIGSVVPYTFLPYQSGGQKLIAQFYEFLSKEAEIHLAGTKDNDKKQVNGYQLHPILPSSRLRYIDIFLFFRLRKLFRLHDVRVVLFEHPYYAWLMWLMKKSGFKIVLHAHNIEHVRFRSVGKWWWFLLKWYEKFAFKQADIAFFISEEDRAYGLRQSFIPAIKSHIVPFGIPINLTPDNKNEARKHILHKWSLNEDTILLLFSGHYGFQPNIDAAEVIIKTIAPLLAKQWNKSYKIIITGKGLPGYLQKDIVNDKSIIYAGFVDSIETYFLGADLFLNTVLSGGGVKTKLIEAIGFGTSVISTQTGAQGVDIDSCKGKLIIVNDNDWNTFLNQIFGHVKDEKLTKSEFYQSYFWGNIAVKVKNILSANA